MLFSRTAVHGIYALCYLNRAGNGRPLPSPVIASDLGIPRDQAAKVLQSLNNAGLVRPTRGRRGGYTLVKRLDDISVVEVLDALNPPEDDERLRPKTCKRDPSNMCNAHKGLQRLNERVREALAGETLSELAGTVCSDLQSTSEEEYVKILCPAQGDNGP